MANVILPKAISTHLRLCLRHCIMINCHAFGTVTVEVVSCVITNSTMRAIAIPADRRARARIGVSLYRSFSEIFPSHTNKMALLLQSGSL